MNIDIFELSMRLSDVNRSLTQIATLMLLDQRYQAGLIDDETYKEILEVISTSLLQGLDSTRESQPL